MDESLITRANGRCVDVCMGTGSTGNTVRLLHTADWHIGRKFHQIALLDQQAAFGEWLVDLVRQESIDAVLVAGDLFDRPTPNGEAVDLLDDIFSRLLSSGTQVIAITGNHDSAERLHFGSAAMAGAGLHIRTERRAIKEMGRPIEMSGSGGGSVTVVPVPYVDPYRVDGLAGAPRTHDALVQAVLERSASMPDRSRAIVLAHAFVGSASTCDSERDLGVGGTGAVAAAAFAGFGHVALGHLHRPQELLGGRAAYAGSPLPYSFSEEHPKSVRILDCGPAIAATTVPIDVGRPVCTVKGSLDDLLASSRFRNAEPAWVRAELTDTSLRAGAMERLRQRFPFILELAQPALRVQFGPVDDARTPSKTPAQRVTEYLDDTFGEVEGDSLDFVLESAGRVLAVQR